MAHARDCEETGARNVADILGVDSTESDEVLGILQHSRSDTCHVIFSCMAHARAYEETTYRRFRKSSGNRLATNAVTDIFKYKVKVLAFRF